jgi:uncharacterized protein YbjT (DUF2867 family)
MKRKILLTGATGTIGSALARRMAAHDTAALRVFVRSPEKAAGLRAAGVEVTQGSFEDAAALRVAVEGVDTLVLITPWGPEMVDQAHAAIVAAQAAHVRRIVRLSVINADPDPNEPSATYRLHGCIEAEIRASGLVYTIVRPNAFMQGLFTGMVESIKNVGKFHMTIADGRFSMIDTRDIVDVFEQVFLSGAYDGQILTLTGPASISLYEAARIFSRVLGREITYIPVPPAEVEQYFRGWGLDGWKLTALCEESVSISQNLQDYTTADVERVTGHPARSLEAFAREVFTPNER